MEAISQNATNLAISTDGEENWDFAAQVARIAKRKASGITREKRELNTNKLVTACLADYRIHFPGIYGKSELLPPPIFNKITEAVFEYQKAMMTMVNHNNVISVRRAFFHKDTEMEVTERVNLVAENIISLQEQHLGINIFLGKAKKRLKDLEAKKTPDFDAEQRCKDTILKCERTLSYIEGEMAKQKKLVEESKKS